MKSWAVPALRIYAICALLSPSVLAGCHEERLLEPDRLPDGGVAARPAAATAPPSAPSVAQGARVQFVHAPDGDVAELVKMQRAAADRTKRAFLVYVGASWCEPCQRFHEAAGKGELDADLPPVTLLEFDADKDVPRLRAAGYSSTYIPLFAVPGADGRGSGRFIEGGIKGANAAREIAPRLKNLLGS